MNTKRRVSAQRGGHLAVLAVNESAAIEFRCRGKPPGTEDRDQQLRYPGNVGLNEALRAHLAHRCPLCWHPLPRPKPKERTLVGRAEAPPTWGHHPRMAGEIILERRAKSNRNAERDHRGFASDFPGIRTAAA
jgi:hypothetical protein